MIKKYLIILGKPGYLILIFLLNVINTIGKIKFPRLKIPKVKFPKIKVSGLKQKRAILLIIVGILLCLTGATLNLLNDLPSPNELANHKPALTTKIYDRNHVLLYKIYKNQNRTLTPLEKIPNSLIQATLAIEDKTFYSHNGISWRGILRAIKHNITNPDKKRIGGSTITQQLIKNTLLSPKQTWKRKIKEAILAILVELKFSKNEILQMYFNEVSYGGTAYGVEEASQKYFDKNIQKINPAEAALLAGLTRAPTDYSPFGSYPEKAKSRQIQVIDEMVNAKFIDKDQAKKIKSTTLRFAPQEEQIKAPHFVFYVKNLLIKQFGLPMVEQGGLEIITTLDLNTQNTSQNIIKQELQQLKKLNINNGASLTINPKTGEVLTMVGSKDYFDFENDGNVNVVLRLRQPGSSIKPINYVTALSKNYTAASIIPDTPITYQIPGQPPYSPKNYDGQFHGNLPIRITLASSLNIPAVKILSSYGVDEMINTGQKMGITTWDDRSRFGLSLTLGGGEVKMIDLAQAYSVLANLGKRININPILKIKDQKGNVLYRNPVLQGNQSPGPKVIDPGIAFIINDILSDNQARALTFGTNSLLQIPNHKVAVKTGTTNRMRDNWCIGYTPSLLTAVWVGNNDNSSMSYVASGVTGATPIWHKIMKNLLEKEKQEDPKRIPLEERWKQPENVHQIAICQNTGTLLCNNCPKISMEYFVKGTEPTKHCFIKPDPTPKSVNPSEPNTEN